MIAQHALLEISGSRLRHNLELLRARLGPGMELCATVKANAYGHGLEAMCGLLCRENVRWAAVYSIDEAWDLMAVKGAEKLCVLALAPLVAQSPEQLRDVIVLLDGTPLRVNVTDEATARALSDAVMERDQGARGGVKVHVQVDTGLTRAGATPAKAERLIELIVQSPGLKLEGIFAHFSHADMPGHGSIREQADRFHALADPWKKRFPEMRVHLQNSAGAIHWRDDSLDMARVGIALYGLQPSTAHAVAGLQPIARMTAPILMMHDVAPGVGVGYGHTFVTGRRSRLAIVPAGYAEGYPRMFSNSGVAQVHGMDVPVAGRVSMDQIILDVTEVAAAKLGDRVTLISWDPEKPNSVDRMADAGGTIGYELATHFGGRLRRIIVD